MNKIYRFFLGQKVGVVYLVLLLSLFLLPSLIGSVAESLTSFNAEREKILFSKWIDLVRFAVITPVFETFVFQKLPFLVLKQKFKIQSWLIITLSALVFGLFHWSNLPYMLFAFSSGIILMFTFIIFHKRSCHPFLTTTSIHSAKNTFAYLAIYYFQL